MKNLVNVIAIIILAITFVACEAEQCEVCGPNPPANCGHEETEVYANDPFVVDDNNVKDSDNQDCGEGTYFYDEECYAYVAGNPCDPHTHENSLCPRINEIEKDGQMVEIMVMGDLECHHDYVAEDGKTYIYQTGHLECWLRCSYEDIPYNGRDDDCDGIIDEYDDNS